MGKGKAEGWKPFPGVNWLGVCAWLVGAAVTYLNKIFMPEIVGIAVTIIVYVILCKAVKNPKYNPFA